MPALTELKKLTIQIEYDRIVEALKESNFNKAKAAKLLGIDRKTLYNKLRAYDALKQAS